MNKISALCLGALLAGPVHAEVLTDNNATIRNGLCVGMACADIEGTGDGHLTLKSSLPFITFEDTSNSASSRDWAIWINAANSSGANFFSIYDIEAQRAPFLIEADAPGAALRVTSNGAIGMGTFAPQKELHLVNDFPSIRLEGTAGADRYWDMQGSFVSFDLITAPIFGPNAGVTQIPFSVSAEAPSQALRITGLGRVGLGTNSPAAQLEISSDDAFNFFRITAAGATVNKSVDITFTGGPLGTGQLRYNIVDGDNQEMSLDADGNMVLAGTLTTAGPTCASGCDRVFDPQYDLPSIADHASRMFDAGHLPSVGPTAPGQPVNLSERMGQMLNALEHAHVYIAQQNDQITQLQADKQALAAQLVQTEADTARQFADLTARLAALE